MSVNFLKSDWNGTGAGIKAPIHSNSRQVVFSSDPRDLQTISISGTETKRNVVWAVLREGTSRFRALAPRCGVV
jgi:hypothetical protein